jgi:hypothetical protein
MGAAIVLNSLGADFHRLKSAPANYFLKERSLLADGLKQDYLKIRIRDLKGQSRKPSATAHIQ